MRSPIPALPAYTVLIVESRSNQRDLYRRTLLADATCRYILLETDSAVAALLMCQQREIDGILIDDTLPDATGLDFVRALQQQQEPPPVVMVASEADPAIVVRAIKQGAEDYLIKHTLTPQQLQTAMRSAIANSRNDEQTEVERSQILVQAETARAEAEAANQSKDEFISLVAHELRSPLTSIMGWAKLLQTRQLDAATTQRALEIIVRNTHAQVQLVEDLLDISRRGTLHVNFASVSLIEVVEAALETVRPTADAKRVQLERFLYNVKPVSGDFNRLQQVVLNLVTNAIKFTPEGGRVQILLDQFHSRARLRVKDTGRGIRSNFLPHIFERFSQDQQETAAKQGLGLGLAIVKSLVEIHNGTVVAESSGEGQGATFTVLLPYSQCDHGEKAATSFPSNCTVQSLCATVMSG